MSKLDDEILNQIRTLALTDTQKLIDLYIDKDKLKICLQRKGGKSFQQIANSMKMPKSTVRDKCKACP
jgi:hypothetical protein